MESLAHTPTPWGVANPGEDTLYIAAGAWPFGSNIARCEGDNQKANADLIVEAVNAYACRPLDQAWEAINVLGGRPEQDNSYDQGMVDAIGKALEIIESLGGMDPKQRASMVTPADRGSQ